MKFSTVIAVLALALSMTGCKYDKINEGAFDESAMNGNGLATGGDIQSQTDDPSLQSGDLGGITGGSFADRYTLCTDVNFAPVYFGFDSSVIPSGELAKIDEVVAHLQSNADRLVSVEGNCDERGSAEYNLTLGQHRAVCIRGYLIQNGISDDRIETRSMGSEKPAVAGHDESAWSMNRRGEFMIYRK